MLEDFPMLRPYAYSYSSVSYRFGYGSSCGVTLDVILTFPVEYERCKL